jgi:lipopolysaccharide transport system ATP-binding protein
MDGSPEEVTRAYIEEVKSEDEEKLIASFSSKVQVYSFDNRCLIGAVKMISGESSGTIVESGDPFRVTIEITNQTEHLDLICRVSIVRLDGLLVFKEDFVLSDFIIDEDKAGLELDFPVLPLAPGIYRLDVILAREYSSKCEELAGSTSIFKVYSLSPPSGGVPMLFYPILGCSTIVKNYGE